MKTKICPTCHGRGFIWQSGESGHPGHPADCPECMGAKVIPDNDAILDILNKPKEIIT
jgi:DnaJ-class molecular chaperone